MRKIQKSYRFLSVGFLLVIFTTVLLPSIVTINNVNVVSSEQTDDEEESVAHIAENDAVFQGIKVDLDKKFVFVKNIVTNESSQFFPFTELTEDLPKILQTLFVSAIPKNAP